MDLLCTPVVAPLSSSITYLAPQEGLLGLSSQVSKEPRARHLFVDNVRFLSMLAIVCVHGMAVLGPDDGGLGRQVLQLPLKFGTIGFFLISGFLLGEGLQIYRPAEYLRRRVRKVFLPWLVWLSLLSVYQIILDMARHRVHLTLTNVGLVFLQQCEACLLSTAFWFVPNLLLALTVLLMFRPYLYDLRLGAGLFLVHLFYVVNLYTMRIPSSHTEALLGFVFDLWLGSYASRHMAELWHWIESVRVSVLAWGLAAALLLGLVEARILTHLHSPDPLNTLRLSNQMFSIVVVLLILKIRRGVWPTFVNVRRETYGIYLAHGMLLAMGINLLNEVRRTYFPSTQIEAGLSGIFIWLLLSAAVYLAALATTRMLAAQVHLRWLVGVDSL